MSRCECPDCTYPDCKCTCKQSDKNKVLEALAKLCEDYDLEIGDTTDQDGVHIWMVDEEIFADFIFHESGPDTLRKAKDPE